MPHFLCGGRGCGREVRDGGLGRPVTGCNAVDDSFGEDAVVETECWWWQVEVALCWGVEGGFVIGPYDGCEGGRWNTEGSVAEVVVAWGLGKDGTRVGLGRAADEAWRATPESVGSCVLWSDGCGVRWSWASDD